AADPPRKVAGQAGRKYRAAQTTAPRSGSGNGAQGGWWDLSLSLSPVFRLVLRCPDPVDLVIGSALRRSWPPVGGVVHVALAAIGVEVWVGVERARPLRALIIVVLRCDHAVMRLSMFDPGDDFGKQVESVRRVAPAAMTHSRHHEDTEPFSRGVQSSLFLPN